MSQLLVGVHSRAAHSGAHRMKQTHIYKTYEKASCPAVLCRMVHSDIKCLGPHFAGIYSEILQCLQFTSKFLIVVCYHIVFSI